MTLNLGGRFDYLNGYSPAQNVPATRYLPARSYAAVENVPNWKDFTTRLGVSYDLFGTGKTAVKASLGRYLQAMTTNLAYVTNPISTSVNAATANWSDANGDFIPQREELGPLNPATFGQPSIVTRFDPEITAGTGARGYDWEGAVGVQHELRPGLSAGATYTRHWYRNFSIVQNQAVTNADFSQYCVTVPVDSRLPGGGGVEMCGFYDVSPAKFGATQYFVTNAKNFGTQDDVYDGVEVSATARLRNGVVLSGGTNTARQRTDNCFARERLDLLFVSGASGQIANAGLGAVATPATIDPRIDSFCNVVPPFQTQAKLYVVYPLPWGFQGSLAFQSLPGPPITANRVYTNAEIAPTLGRNLASGPNGTAILNLVPRGVMYGDRLNQVDGRVAKTFSIGRTRLQAQMDVYNLFNANPVTSVNARYGANWLQPIYILPGRLLKLGVQMTF
ncbi:MAG: hypothetical protein ACREUU_08240 [Gammaproteobacteria bacterium]